MKNDLLKRSVTALFLASVTGFSFYFGGNHGLLYLGLVFCVVGCFEYAQLMMTNIAHERTLFFIFSSALLSLMVFQGVSLAPVATLMLLYFSLVLWLLKKRASNERKLSILYNASFGFIYVALLPMAALMLINEDPIYFLGLLLIVFSSDVFAYLGGVNFGKKKFYEELSPSKSIEGSISGLLGAVLVGLAWYYYFDIPNSLSISPLVMVILSLLCGFLAQTGDLAESLVKRVAQKKDSGKLLPGHGGVLDRLDGVYFAAPLFYLAIQYFS